MQPLGHPLAPVADEAAARRALREQIARLDGELADLGRPYAAVTRSRRGAALKSLAELERTRDALAAAASDERRRLDELGADQEAMRRVREELLTDPARHRFARVTNADGGEAGCRDWHVRPRFGLLGMLAGWWRVVISSGCPLPRAARGVAPRAACPSRSGSRPSQPETDDSDENQINSILCAFLRHRQAERGESRFGDQHRPWRFSPAAPAHVHPRGRSVQATWSPSGITPARRASSRA